MAEINSDLIPAINQSVGVDLPLNTSFEDLSEKLSLYINYLIEKDFPKLVAILYRIDVDEKKLRQLLQENTDKEAGVIIARLIIERQLQKIKTRKSFKPDENISDDDKW